MDLILAFDVFEVFVFAAAALEQMLDRTQFDCYCFVGVEVIGFVDLAETALSDQLKRLVSLH